VRTSRSGVRTSLRKRPARPARYDHPGSPGQLDLELPLVLLHLDLNLAIEIWFDVRGRITNFDLRTRMPIPPYPGAGRDVGLRLALAGTWWVYRGGRTERQNNHTVTPDPRHAYDLVKSRRGGTSRGRGTRNRDYFAFDRRVVAPAGGVVVEAHDGLRDNRPCLEGASRPAPTGNHVLLALGADRYVLLAHLKRGSVPVHTGRRVRTRQALGLATHSVPKPP
jgi:hypothetical protein